VRIAISGTHSTGKSTLIAELAPRLPDYEPVEEPYHALCGEGYEFADQPSIEDFELMLYRSISDLEGAGSNVLFDRCPADYLGYLAALYGQAGDARGDMFRQVAEVMGRLDLIVFVPIEHPDRIGGTGAGRRLRSRVNDLLRELLLEGTLGVRVPVVEVTGSPHERASQVLARLAVIPG
jgi:hypothetical protein